MFFDVQGFIVNVNISIKYNFMFFNVYMYEKFDFQKKL